MKPLINRYHLEALKRQILERSCYEQLASGDCKAIAAAIAEKTNCRLSETTLKRLFGFAKAKYMPSVYTMDVLAQYCGYKHWADYSLQACNAAKSQINANTCVQSLRERIHRITTCTLQTLKDKSGIPFSNTVSRRFLDEHINFFNQSRLPGTVLFAPTGYGKTTALCHWVNNFLAQRQQHYLDGDMVFFFSFNALSNAYFSGRDVHTWLLSMLGYNHDDEFSHLLSSFKENNHTFFLMIDGLDGVIVKDDAFRLIVEQVADVFAHYNTNPAFKMVLTMRTGTLRMFEDTLMADENLWFKGFVNDITDSNVPLLNSHEIKEIADRANPKIKHEVTVEQARQLEYPLYLQYYYRSVKDNFTLAQVNRTTSFEQIIQFVRTRVYNDTDPFEKQLIADTICEHMLYNESRFYAVKNDLIDIIRPNKTAYQDLLTDGYIVESINHSNIDGEVRVRFANEDLLCYAMVQQLFRKNANRINKQLFEDVNNLSASCPHRLKVIKWLVICSFKTEQLISADMLNAVNLSVSDQADLIKFWVDLLQKYSLVPDKEQYMQRLLSQDDLVGYFIGNEFFDTEYQATLQALGTFELSGQSRALVHAALALNAVLLLDLNELEKQICLLKACIDQHQINLPFDPVICMNTFYEYLKYGTVKQDAFVTLTKVCFNGINEAVGKNVHPIFYLLGLYTLKLSGNTNKILRLIDVFDQALAEQKANYPAYAFIIKNARAELLLPVDKTKGVALYKELSKIHTQHYNEHSALMKVHFALLKLKVMMLQKDVLNIQPQIQAILSYTDQNGFRLFKARCLNLILQQSQELHLSEETQKKIHYDLVKITRDHDLYNDWFVEGAA